MEGRVSNFSRVLADFESRLAGAEYVALDTELTGTDLEGEPDTFEDSASVRLDRICRIAERYTLIQLGLTVVGRPPGNSSEGSLVCTSYNLFAFPHVDPEISGREVGFFCQATALQFNAKHGVDFNTWIGEGIPYMSREEEQRYLASRKGKRENHAEEKVGLLRLWKVLCNARIPFVVHTPLDLFFLLAAFERRPLPRNDPRAVAALIRKCTPRVYDTAYLHGSLDRFRRLGLMKFYEDVQARYESLAGSGLQAVPNVKFKLQGPTAGRYGKKADELAHEAGFDSLITAQLFAYLRAIAPKQVKEGVNRLFLYRSVEYLDLDRATTEGEISRSMFDLSRVTLLVAVLNPVGGFDARREISAAGITFRTIDSSHLLVVLRASGGAAVRKAAELAAQVHGVSSWMPFEHWRSSQASASRGPRGLSAAGGSKSALADSAGATVSKCIDGGADARACAAGTSPIAAAAPREEESADDRSGRRRTASACCEEQRVSAGPAHLDLASIIRFSDGVYGSRMSRLLASGAVGFLLLLLAARLGGEGNAGGRRQPAVLAVGLPRWFRR